MVWAEMSYRAVFLNSDGSPAGSIFQIAPGYASYDGMTYEYNPVSNTYLFMIQDPNDSGNVVVEMQADGTQGTPLTVFAPDGSGNFNPRAVASLTRKEWLVTTTHLFKSTYIRRVGSGR